MSQIGDSAKYTKRFIKKGESKKKKISIFYDGECPMCSAVVAKINNSSRSADFKYIDATTATLPKSLTRRDALKEIHVIDESGNTHKNADAILKIIEGYPGYKLLARVGRFPIIRQALKLVYKFIAANRHAS